MKSGYHHDDGTQNLAEHNVILQETEERSVVDAAAVRGVILRIFTSSFEDRKLSTVERGKLLPLVYWAKKQMERHPVTHKDLLLCLGVNRTDSSADVCRKPWPFPSTPDGDHGRNRTPTCPCSSIRRNTLGNLKAAASGLQCGRHGQGREPRLQRESLDSDRERKLQREFLVNDTEQILRDPTNCNAYAAVHL